MRLSDNPTPDITIRSEHDRRVLRLGQALRTFAEELAAARREIDRLQTENRRLLEQVR